MKKGTEIPLPRAPGITTKRKPLTQHQRSKMFSEHGGICVICKLPITPGKPWIDEHIRALGLMGTNEKRNRGPAHIYCADVKTKTDDMPRINKAKAQQAKSVSRDPDSTSKIQSAKFPAKDKPSKHVDPNPHLRRKELFK